MEWYDSVLDRLDKVKSQGTDRWVACCPVHDDKNPSMSISVKTNRGVEGGEVLLFHCHSCGAKGDSVVKSLGLSASSLFQNRQIFDADDNWLLKKTKEEDDMYIAIYDSAVNRGEKPRYSDYKAYKVSKARDELRKGLNL